MSAAGVDVRWYPLVFAIALFSLEPAEMQNPAFTPKDIAIVKTVGITGSEQQGWGGGGFETRFLLGSGFLLVKALYDAL